MNDVERLFLEDMRHLNVVNQMFSLNEDYSFIDILSGNFKKTGDDDHE